MCSLQNILVVLRAILFFFPFLFSISCLAADYPVKYLGIEQGLSNNSVNNIYQDHNGFMWFCTYDGLNRYDGYEFKIYRNKTSDSTSLATNMITQIAEDVQHNLWVSGARGLSIYSPSKSKFFSAYYFRNKSNSPIKFKEITYALISDTNGNVLIGTMKQGLIVFKNNSTAGKQVPLTGHAGNIDVTTITFSSSGQTAWMFAQGIGLCRYNMQEQTFTLVNNDIKNGNFLKEDKEGNLWLGNESGLYKYNVSANTYSGNRLPGNAHVTNVCIDKLGVMWIATDGRGLFILHPNKESAIPFLSIENKPLVRSNAVTYVLEDKEGRKWIGSLRGGITIVGAKEEDFKTTVFEPGIGANPDKNFILSLAEDPLNNLWIGTDGGGLRYLDQKTRRYKSYLHLAENDGSLSSNFITGILVDYMENTWISVWAGGINRYNKTTGSFKQYKCYNPFKGEEEKNIWFLFEDSQKKLWASATNRGTLYCLNRPSDKFEVFDTAIADVQCMTEDRDGNLWAGNYFSLIKIDRANKKHVVYNLGFTMRFLHEDRKGNFWICTDGGGLLLFDRKKGTILQQFTDEQGLPGNSLLRMLEDKAGNLWISTFSGLSRFNPSKKVFRNFFQSDGLQSDQFSFNASLALKSGEFLFGGINGFTRFYPDKIDDSTIYPPIFLNGIRINNIPAEQDDSDISERSMEGITAITVPYDAATISIDFVALQFDGASKINYAYYLEGWDKGWNYVNKSRTANYSRLQEGSYVFKVKAAAQENKWGNEISLLHVRVLPPWYRTWWAWLLYTCCAALLIYAFVRYTKNQQRLKYELKHVQELMNLNLEIQQKNTDLQNAFTSLEQSHNENNRIIKVVAHDLRNPISGINNLVNSLLKKQLPEELKEVLGIIRYACGNSIALIKDLLAEKKELRDIQKEMVDLGKLLQQCVELLQIKADEKNQQLSLKTEHVIVMLNRQKIWRVISNIINNAIKFSPENAVINIHLKRKKDTVLLSVHDNGIGIPAELHDKIFELAPEASRTGTAGEESHGLGLSITQKIIEEHHGKIWFESEAGEGSVFYVELPYSN